MAKKIVFLLFILVFAGMVGCATVKNTRPGFLKDYSAFTKSQRYSGMLVDNTNIAKIKNYDKYIIEAVIIDFKNKNKRDPVPQEAQQEVAVFYHDAVVKALQDKYQIVDAPGPGVLRVRLAITDIETSRLYLNAASLAQLEWVEGDGVLMESEAVDSVSAERIAAVIDFSKAIEWYISKGLTEWGFAKDICADWAKMLRERLDAGYVDIAVAADNPPAADSSASQQAVTR